jgi:hypothetical protein
VESGPAAVKAYLAAIKTLPSSNGIDANAINQYIEQAVAKKIGVGADQNKHDQDTKGEKKSVLEQFRGPRTKAHDYLDLLKQGAEKTQRVKE